MPEQVLTIITFATALGAGVTGGVFFAFSSFVMGALARLPAAQGIAAMQSINIVVINPLFLGVMFGTGAACVALILGALLRWQAAGAAYLLAGGAVYLAGCILVTMVCNVPRNNALAAWNPAAVESAALWSEYVSSWTLWNHVRAVASILAAALFILALI
ncbi:MAG TPA: anthrone oxygenase family protein [Dongiaceae bacterium]|nr:anthrone oxygenase family protein [Dongiaceae bacterium]